MDEPTSYAGLVEQIPDVSISIHLTAENNGTFDFKPYDPKAFICHNCGHDNVTWYFNQGLVEYMSCGKCHAVGMVVACLDRNTVRLHWRVLSEGEWEEWGRVMGQDSIEVSEKW